MESNDLRALSELYLKTVYEAKAESPEEEEEKMKKDDDLAGSPNKKKNGKKADKDYDGDGKVESSKDEYFGSKDKAIKKAMGKDVKEARWWDVDVNEAVYGGKKEEKKDTRMVVTAADKKANTPAYQNYKAGMKRKDGSAMYKAADHMKEGHSTDTKGKKNCGCGQDPCVTYGKQDKNSMQEGYGKKKKKKGHDCASKVKHEEYGMGDCIKEMHTLDENGNVTHYDVMFESKIVKNIPVSDLVVIEGMYHEHFVNDEKNQEVLDEKEGYKTVAAVIDYDRSKKGTDDATYDSMHGDKKGAKKERDYAAFEREKMKKDDPNWKHKKGSTSEEVEYDELDNDLLEFAENTLGNFPEGEILDMMESMWHRRNPGKKHPLESGSSKVKRRPVSDQEKKSTDKEDRMYVAMRRVSDRQKGYSAAKSKAADKLHSTYTDRQAKRKRGASAKEAAAQSHGEFGGKGFNIKRGGRGSKGSHAPETDRGKGSKAKKRAEALK